MKGLVGGPLLVGGLGPGPPEPPPLKSGPVSFLRMLTRCLHALVHLRHYAVW